MKATNGFCPSGTPAEASPDNYLPLNLHYPGLKKVHASPPIYVCDNFLTEEECESFIRVAGPLLQRSKTHAIAGSEATKGRTSLTCHLAKKTFPCPILLQKIQALTNKPFGHMELPQVARYTDSQRYVEHYDGVDPNTDAGRAFCANGGQRVATVLCYLNDVADGGATAFRRVNFEVKPVKGSALIFFPGFMNGDLDTDALHAGMPAISTKWVSQVWIRQSYREDGQPSMPVPDSERTLVGPLHKGFYRGHCLAGDDILEEVMTVEEAIQRCNEYNKKKSSSEPACYGFTYNSADKDVKGRIRIWFKSRLSVLYNEQWWTYSNGLGMD